MNKDMVILAFDFSLSKPAMCALINGKYHFYTWPAKIDKKTYDKLIFADINVYNRELTPINKKLYDSHSLVLELTKRINELTDLIIGDILKILNDNFEKWDYNNVIISSEGLSFGSKGDQTLNLAAAKQVLLCKLYSLGFRNIKTYSPMTIKSIAGTAKHKNYSKLPVIESIREENENYHKFIKTLKYNPELLKKKTTFINTVDDLCDAYFCLKTTLQKEFNL